MCVCVCVSVCVCARMFGGKMESGAEERGLQRRHVAQVLLPLCCVALCAWTKEGTIGITRDGARERRALTARRCAAVERGRECVWHHTFSHTERCKEKEREREERRRDEEEEERAGLQ